MKITWLGQAGMLLEGEKTVIMIDPYLSDSVGKSNPQKHRREVVPDYLFDIRPDIMIFTHNHLDHYDPETVERFISADTSINVLSPYSVWKEVRKLGGENNFVLFNRGTTWTQSGIKFTAVAAEHSDEYAIGVIVIDGDKKYYFTGDTLYNERVFKDIPNDIHALFLPINGVGNNMNMADAKAFCERINPHYAVPVHCGLFDDIEMNNFGYEKKIIPEIYKEIELR